MKKQITMFIAGVCAAQLLSAMPIAAESSRIAELNVLDSDHAAAWAVRQNLQVGSTIYGDRDAAFNSLPDSLIGAEWVQTACDSKAYDGNLAELTLAEESAVIVALDARVSPTPAWIGDWTLTAAAAGSDKDVTYNLYAKDCTRTVTLGTNGQSSGCVNYAVFVAESGITDALYAQGDANRDGAVNAEDATALQQYLLTAITDISMSADMDSNGRLNAADLTLLKRSLMAVPNEPETPVVPYDQRTFSFSVGNLFNQSNTDTLGLKEAAGTETVTVWKAQKSGDHYCNGVCMAAYKGRLYCQWQSSATDEDSADTHVMYAVSSDKGRTWSDAKVLAQNLGDGYCTSGGWLATETGLVAYINYWPDNLSNPRGGWTYYVTSQDGENWTAPKQVTMADGKPISGIFEQDPHILSTGRIVNAAHFQSGLFVCPIYTDDPSGVTGWKKGEFTATGNGSQSVELEPSIFTQSDGTLCMIFRDQSGSYQKLISYSFDDGTTWSKVQKTDMPDARTKQSAGNLSDGTAFMAGCPVNNSLRSPLAVTLSADGKSFTQAFLLRSNSSDPALIYEGKAKRLGFHYCKSLVSDGYLYVGYATNKEAVEITIVPESGLMMNQKT